MVKWQQGSWVQRLAARWSSGSHQTDRQRWSRAGADVSLAFLVIIVTAVLVLMFKPASESSVPQQSGSPDLAQPPAPVKGTVLRDNALLAASSPPKAEVDAPLDVVAYVDNRRRNRDVIPDSEGWVEKIVNAKPGRRVKRGDILLEIYSPGLVQLQMDYLDSQQRKDALALIDARNRLRAHGQSEEAIRALAVEHQADGVVRVLAPCDGVVADVYVPEGIFVPHGIAAVNVVDLSSLWMSASIPAEKNTGLVPGARVEARTPQLGDTVLRGEIAAVEPLIDGADTVTVQVRFDDNRSMLAERQYADLRIFPAESQALQLPTEVKVAWPDE